MSQKVHMCFVDYMNFTSFDLLISMAEKQEHKRASFAF